MMWVVAVNCKSNLSFYGNFSSTQNNGWKLVGHLFKVATFLQTIFGFPIVNVQ